MCFDGTIEREVQGKGKKGIGDPYKGCMHVLMDAKWRFHFYSNKF